MRLIVFLLKCNIMTLAPNKTMILFNLLIKSIILCCVSLASTILMAANVNKATVNLNSNYIANLPTVRAEVLEQIAPLINDSIKQGKYPGAIVLVSHHGKIIYRGVFGNRQLSPSIAPMRFDTIFDVASLTKVVATTPAIMQLIEQGKLQLDDKVSQYWPEFTIEGKENITVRELLTHTSGLPADIEPKERGAIPAYNQISRIKLIHAPGSMVTYSDINFIVLGRLVEIISHESLHDYTQKHIFKFLGMKNTQFLPDTKLKKKIAPTEIIDDHLRWGEVHDPTAYAMGGVAGHAGLFSTASDLAIYAQCLLNSGRIPIQGKTTSRYLLGPLTVLKMTTPQTPPQINEVRGLGWDIDSYQAIRGSLLPAQSYGHTGWTGTSMWMDPVTQTWIIILTNRIHPHAQAINTLSEDRRKIANIVAASLTDIPTSIKMLTEVGEIDRAYKLITKKH